MYAMLVFDTEDIYFAPGDRIDDVPGWLAETMTQAGITGTFFVMGEKAAALKERGRADVLQEMARHEIGSHQQGNRHPLVPEALQNKSWDEGVDVMRLYEDWVKEALSGAFGKDPLSFSRHNCYFGPQHVAVAGERGLPYMYMVAQIPGSQQPLWYAGALTFPSTQEGYFEGFDLIYSRDELFEAKLRELDEFVEQCLEAGREWITVFGCHPVRVLSRGWLEHYALASGMTRTPLDLGWRYGVKSTEEEERAKANFQRLCRYLAEHPDIAVVGVNEAAGMFSTQPTFITRDALAFYSEDLAHAKEIVFHAAFSPAEMVCALSESLLHHEECGDLPEKVLRREVLGPHTRPVVGLERGAVTHSELLSLCRQVVTRVESEGCLPANVTTSSERVGLSQFALLAASSYLALARYEKVERLRVTCAPRYPQIAFQIDEWIRKNIGEHWAMPLDFSIETLAEHARLQTWTMKPAWTRPPQGRVADGRKYGPRTPLGRA